jgi:hypothetical protein
MDTPRACTQCSLLSLSRREVAILRKLEGIATHGPETLTLA